MDPGLSMQVSLLSVQLPDKAEKQLYAELRWRDQSLRSDTFEKRFDPMAGANASTRLSCAAHVMNAPPPLTSDDIVTVVLVQCQMFGDKVLASAAFRLMNAPLLKGVPTKVAAGPFTVQLTPFTFGEEPTQAQSVPRDEVVTVVLESVKGVGGKKKRGGKKARRKQPEEEQELVPDSSVLEFSSDESSTYDPTEGVPHDMNQPVPAVPASAQKESAPLPPSPSQSRPQPAGISHADIPEQHRGRDLPPVRGAATAVAGTAATGSGGSDQQHSEEAYPSKARNFNTPPAPLGGVADTAPFEVVRNADSIGDLTWRGELPPIQPFYALPVRTPVVTQPKSKVGSLFSAVKGVVNTAVNTIGSRSMASDFPEVPNQVFVEKFTPHMLNGHGVPIEVAMYVTETHVLIHGPLIHVVLPFKQIAQIRKLRALSNDAIQLLTVDHKAYQTCEYEGVRSKVKAMFRDEEATQEFRTAWNMLNVYWRQCFQ